MSDLNNRESALIFRRLGALGQGGLPLRSGLLLLEKEGTTSGIRTWAKKARFDIESGKYFWETLSRHKIKERAAFLWIKAGEMAGDLVSAFNETAAYLEERLAFQKKVISALSYPSFLMIGFFGVLGFASMTILPQFESLFKETNQRLPFVTRLALSLGKIFPYLLLSFVPAVLFLSKKLRAAIIAGFDRWTWRVPFLSSVRRLFFLSSWSARVACFLKRGFSFYESVKETTALESSPFIQKRLRRFVSDIWMGQSPSEAAQEPLFSYLERESLKMGEMSGDMGSAMSRLTLIKKEELNQFFSRTLSLAEPILIIFIALLIGLMGVGLVLPIFDYNPGLG